MKFRLIPYGAYVVAKKSVSTEDDMKGMYIPDAAKNAPTEAVVEEVGGLVKDIKRGDHIIYEDHLTKKTYIEGVEYLIIKAEDILAKVESK